MAMVVVDDSCLQANSQPKSCGLVWGLAAAWPCSTFIKWTEWTVAMTLWSWWQHYKHCHGYYYYYIIHYFLQLLEKRSVLKLISISIHWYLMLQPYTSFRFSSRFSSRSDACLPLDFDRSESYWRWTWSKVTLTFSATSTSAVISFIATQCANTINQTMNNISTTCKLRSTHFSKPTNIRTYNYWYKNLFTHIYKQISATTLWVM